VPGECSAAASLRCALGTVGLGLCAAVGRRTSRAAGRHAGPVLHRRLAAASSRPVRYGAPNRTWTAPSGSKPCTATMWTSWTIPEWAACSRWSTMSSSIIASAVCRTAGWPPKKLEHFAGGTLRG
jgi:hypothetical protein